MAEKILIVDDDLDTLRLVGLMLQRQGYSIAAASNGHQALIMAESEMPDLIILDVMMPDMDGVEVTRRLRAGAMTRDIPIIMFTAKTQVEDKIEGFDAGVDDYLTKPTQPRELLAHVRAVLARSTKARQVTPPAEKGCLIGLISARGGLGVSTLALNLGIALQEAQEKDVLVAEFRPGQATVSLELGYLKSEGLTRLLQRKPSEINARSVELELTAHASGVRFLLASTQPKDARLLNAVENFEAIAHQLPYLARYSVIDLGSGLTPMAEKVLTLCDVVVVVVEPVSQTIWQSKALIEDIIELGVGKGRISVVLVNRIRSGMQLSWSQVQEQLDRKVEVIFTPAPELAYQASTHNRPMVSQQPDSLTAQQFQKLAEAIVQTI